MSVVDHGPLIKRNFIILMNKNQDLGKTMDSSVIHKAAVYKNALLQLPMHPILSEEDLKSIHTYPFVLQQMQYLISTGKDLEEVTEYEHARQHDYAAQLSHTSGVSSSLFGAILNF